MIKGKRVLAVVPARGGSKGVPLKNIQPIKGVPLIVYTARVIQNVPAIDRAVVSTDHAAIKHVAEEAGLAAPFVRPRDLSADRVADWPVLVHALKEMERRDKVTYDIVLMLQPTSPLRTAGHINACLDKLVSERLDSVWTVSEVDVKHHPLKQLVMTKGRLGYFNPQGRRIVARQQLGKTYVRNGAVYAITRGCLLKQKWIMGKKAGAVIIKEPLVNIDSADDFKRLDALL